MGKVFLIAALGLGAGAYFLSRPRARSRGLEGTKRPKKGIDGSPFFVRCDFDRDSYRSAMEVFKSMDPKKAKNLATRSATSCEWGCVDGREVRVAKFRDRTNPDEVAYLARSTKPEGGWQISWFDKQGPWGDVPRKSQCEAVRVLGSGYENRGRVVIADGEPMSNWYLEAWE